MTIELRLLDGVSCGGVPVAGARPGDLLAALALHPKGLPDERLVDEVWRDERPAVPAKALQVLVSRLRGQAGPALITRYDGGYRLGLPVSAVDAWLLDRWVDEGRTALESGDPQRALSVTTCATDLLGRVAEPVGAGALAELRARARSRAPEIGRCQGMALSRCGGRDADAVTPLTAAHDRDLDDPEVLLALLRSEAASAGVPVALARYDDYRRDLADRLGIDPAPELQRLHRELLAADEPVRSGVRFEADELLGRADDLARLRALVRSGRLTTILGPGGLGKTRIAHVLAREATQPRVHFVELVGLGSPEDVVAEVGSALGVRNSVTGRRTLTQAQLADVRGRIARELDSVPTLLVLDNCEHVLDAIASLVAFLLATTRDLSVVTTSRAPLGIAAERVFLLSQLAPADGAELFCRRARAVRPDAELPSEVVDAIVERLDGLPLAVELAAARIRTMTADDVRRALTDRFALLRGRDRTAPARHQTLTAVIAWSWDLLSTDQQRALSWLSVFHDGFGLGSALAVLGPQGTDLVDALVDQSLLTVQEDDRGLRYRMLETVREFGGQRLRDRGWADEARAAQIAWAVGLAERLRPDVFGPGQVEAVDELAAEEGNLADVLRRCLADDDLGSAVRLLAVLGALWSITGSPGRFFAMADIAEQALVGFRPPPDLAEVTGEAIALLLVHVGFMRPQGVEELAEVMRSLGPPTQPWARVIHAMFVETESVAGRVPAALALTRGDDRRVEAVAWQWAAIVAENDGEIDDARSYVDRALALVDETTTPWEVATLHTQRAMLAFNAGDHRLAAERARVAIPLLDRLHASEDALAMRASVALALLRDGDLDGAERELAAAGDPSPTDMTSVLVKWQVGAEMMLGRGDVDGALAAFDEALAAMRAVRFAGLTSTGLEPWSLIALATDLVAHARLGESETHRERAAELAADALTALRGLATAPEGGLDYPVTGMGLVALGAWLLIARPTPASDEAGVRLLGLARGFGYNRWFPVVDWEPLAELAESVAPGRLAVVLDEYDGRRGRDLRADVDALLTSLDLTSSG